MCQIVFHSVPDFSNVKVFTKQQCAGDYVGAVGT